MKWNEMFRGNEQRTKTESKRACKQKKQINEQNCKVCGIDIQKSNE